MSSYCEFCNNEYANKKILKNHQKTAKFCIEIQKKTQNKTVKKSTNINLEKQSFRCEYCDDDFTQKSSLERHYESCKIKKINYKEHHLIQELKDELIILKTKYEYELKMKEEKLKMKEEKLKMKEEQYIKELKMKDNIISKLEKENESLKQENKETYANLLDRSDKTYNKFFEKEEKLVDTLLQQNNSSKQSKTVQNHLTIHNYGIKPLTAESVINAFESFSSRSSTAFNAFQYDGITLERGSMKLEFVFFGIIRELKDYYGITDISREKVIFNNNGEMTLTTVQEFIRTNIVMNNIDLILEWISNLLSQIRQRIEDGNIDINGEMREMTEIEKNKLSDTGESLEYIYKLFKVSKDKGMANNYMTKLLSDGAIKEGKVISKVPTLKGNLN